MGLLDEAIREHLELKRLRGADPSEIARLEREALGPARRGLTVSEADLEAADHPAHPGEPLPGTEYEEGHQPFPLPAGASGSAFPTPEPGFPVQAPDDSPAPTTGAEPADVGQDVADARYEADHDRDLTEPRGHRRLAVAGEETTEFDVEALAHAESPPAHEPPAHRESELPPPSEDPSEKAAREAAEAEAAALADAAGLLEAAEEVGPPVDGDEAEAAQHHAEPHEPPADEPPTGKPDDSEDVLEETPDFLQETPEHDRLWFEQRPPRDFDFDK